jgi:hypothetical protein
MGEGVGAGGGGVGPGGGGDDDEQAASRITANASFMGRASHNTPARFA